MMGHAAGVGAGCACSLRRWVTSGRKRCGRSPHRWFDGCHRRRHDRCCRRHRYRPVAASAVVAIAAHVQCCCTAERFDRRRSPGPHDRWAPPGMRMADAPFAVPRSTSSTAGTSAFRPMKHGPAAAAHRRRMVSSHAHQEESTRALCCRVQMLPELHLPPEMANSAPPRGRSADPNRRNDLLHRGGERQDHADALVRGPTGSES